MTLPYPFAEYLPSSGDVGAIFADEIAALGGTLVDIQGDDARMFGRALLLQGDDVTPGDTIRGGIAIQVRGPEVSVHGYTQRLVCVNGAIGAVPGEQVRIERASPGSPIEVVTPVHDAIREAVRQLAAGAAFAQTVTRMRHATHAHAFHVVQSLHAMLHAMSALAPAGWHDRVIHEVMQRWLLGGDRSLFGLLNAVTSTARDEPSPALKWELEVIGGRLLEGAVMPRLARAARPIPAGVDASREAGVLVEAGA